MSQLQAPLPTDIAPQPLQTYIWRGYRCAFEQVPGEGAVALLLIHPIGVGLSRQFWYPFCRTWVTQGSGASLYLPDLLGCGDSSMPAAAYQPEDWADQLLHFLTTVVRSPVVLVAQGALLPVALLLAQKAESSGLVKGLVLAGPPAWSVTTNETPTWQNRLLWALFASPAGRLFYRYARRRQFLASFSEKQLFERGEDVTEDWLSMLTAGAADPGSRHAVFSFLAGFWRRDYQQVLETLPYPVLVAVGTAASSISQSGKSETPEARLERYLQHLAQGEGVQVPGRNVLPYESAVAFVKAIAPFVADRLPVETDPK
ncbi:MAG: alpha/beta fold hydrolase [Cyanobacteria bacterium P01_A01_bin.135]